MAVFVRRFFGVIIAWILAASLFAVLVPERAEAIPSMPESSEPQEIVSMRQRDASFYRNPDGTEFATLSPFQNYQASPGVWEKVDLNFRASGADFVVDRNAVTIRVTNVGIRVTDRVSGKGSFWPTPAKPSVSGSKATFTGPGGLVWSYFATRTGVKLVAKVSQRIGAVRLAFPYQLLGGASSFTVDEAGNLVSDAFVVPRPFAIGADHKIYPAGAWRIAAGNLVEFDLDDSQIPLTAFPYDLDPSMDFAPGSDENLTLECTSGGITYPPSCSSVLATSGYLAPAKSQFIGGNSVSNGLIQWDTSGLPDDATVISAKLKVDIADRYGSAVDNRSLVLGWRTFALPVLASDHYTTGSDPVPPSSAFALSGLSVGVAELPLSNAATNVSKTAKSGLRLTISGGQPTGGNGVFIPGSEHTIPPTLIVDYNRPPSTPTLVSPANGIRVATATPTLEATTTDPESDPLVYKFQVDADGNFASGAMTSADQNTNTFAVLAGWLLSNGTTYHWRAQVRDQYSAFTAWSSVRTFTVDTLAPLVSLTNPAANSRTNDTTPTFAGTAGLAVGDNSTVTVKLYSGSSATGSPLQTLSTTRNGTTGAFSVDASSPLSEGTYTVVAQQSDTAGNIGNSAPRTFVVDLTPPLVTLTQPIAASTIGDNLPTFSGTAGLATGDTATVTVKVHSGTSTAGSVVQTLSATRDAVSGAYSVEAAAPLAEGTYTALAEQLDTAGNTGASAPVTFTVQVLVPAVAIDFPVDNAAYNADSWKAGCSTGATDDLCGSVVPYPGTQLTSVTYSIKRESTGLWWNGSSFASSSETSFAVTGTTAWNVAFPFTYFPGDGTYLIRTRATEAGGQTGEDVSRFVIDATAPAVSLTYPATGAVTDDAMPSVGGVAGSQPNSDASMVRVNVYAGSVVVGEPVRTFDVLRDEISGAYAVDVVPQLAAGTYTVRAEQADSASNIGFSAASTFTVDPTASGTRVVFSYTGQPADPWVVPPGVTSVRVKVWGAQGGYPRMDIQDPLSGYGGLGGYVNATLAVEPGEAYQIRVGGQGRIADTSLTPPDFGGGYNGGGGAKNHLHSYGGGGASDIRIDTNGNGIYESGERRIAAGGGGGAGESDTMRVNYPWDLRHVKAIRGMGGSGGGLIGGAGEISTDNPDARYTGYGSGGTQTEGGRSGDFNLLGNPPYEENNGPSSGGENAEGERVGGLGGESDAAPGGGGGGGYYGGGGGAGAFWGGVGAGGGGGSSWTHPTKASSVAHVQGARQGNGLVEISWPILDEKAVTPPTGSKPFSYTGKPEWWTVPNGVTAVRIEAAGAQGGGLYGGPGGRVDATLAVTPGELLQINVGGQGNVAAGTDQGGGFNGGGIAGPGSAHGGGGATDVRRGGVTLSNRILVAAGGGGPGINATGFAGPGGSGGGLSGQGGEMGNAPWCQSPGGAGATQQGPGASAYPGKQGLGGPGAGDGGGGGGGGYWGGGGADGCGVGGGIGRGGGGGSSYVIAEATGVTHRSGTNLGDGSLKISWPPSNDLINEPPAFPDPFTYTGNAQAWVVPAGVHAIRVVASGAQGGGPNGLGGSGASVDAVLLVEPRDVLHINVGGRGRTAIAGGDSGAGYGGGEAAGGANAGGGGGASDIRLNGSTISNRVIVAGGGGGEGGPYQTEQDNILKPGGAGGYPQGGSGAEACGNVDKPSTGGTQTSGGIAWSTPTADPKFHGKLAFGGLGDNGTQSGGGGGGGWYGGAGGCGALIHGGGGGGGGSSWTDSSKAFLFDTSGGRTGDGLVTITSFPIAAALGYDSYGEYVHNVHIGSGNFVESVTDTKIATAGPELELTRTYNSLDITSGIFGKGWSSSYELRAQPEANGSVTIVYPDGRRENHLSDGSGGFTAPKGYVSTLSSQAGGGWLLTHKDKTTHTFSSAGRLTAIADAYGRALTLTYTGSLLSRVSDATGTRYLDFTYNANGRVTTVATPAVSGLGYSGPHRWNYVYGAGDLLSKVCDARDPRTSVGKCTTYTYTSSRLTKITRPSGDVSRRVAYKTDGKVSWSENGVGDRATFTYGFGVTQVKDGRGYATTYFYDLAARTTRIIDPLGSKTVYAYDENGFRDSVTDANGNSVTMDFNARGSMLWRRNAENETTWFEYSGDDLIKQRDARSSSATDTTYMMSFTYNDQGDVRTETSPPTAEHPSGVVKTRTYTVATDNFGWGVVPPGLVKTQSVPVGTGTATTSFEYDDKGDLRKRTDPSGLVTTFVYDAVGRMTSSTVTWETGSATSSFGYDQLGNVRQVTEPAVTNVVTNVVNRKQSTFEYDDDVDRFRMVVADIGGSASPTPTRTTTYDYDLAGRLWRVTDPKSGVTSRTFDRNGNVISVTDPEGRTHQMVYDSSNRTTEIRLLGFVDDPVAGSTPRTVALQRFRYDSAGRKTAEVSPAPGTGGLAGQLAPGAMQERWISYDKADRVLTVTQKGFDNRDGTLRDIVLESYGYDDAGNRTSVITGGGLHAVTNQFDQAGLLQASTLEMGAADRVTEFDYDQIGDITRTAVSASGSTAKETRTVFDTSGRMTQKIVENGATDLTTYFTYDRRGLQLSMVDPRAANPSDANFTTSFAYDVAGRLTQVTGAPVPVDGGPSTTIPTQKIGYDAVGNPVVSRDPRGNVTTTTFDVLNRKERIDFPAYTPPVGAAIAAFETFTYDAVGNLEAHRDRRGSVTEYEFDARNRVVRQRDPLLTGYSERGSTRFQYDDAGNRTKVVDPTGAEVSFAFDDLGRVRAQTAKVRQPAPERTYTTTFDYDDLGNITFTDDPTGVTQTRTYNAASELTVIRDELGKDTTLGYDAASRNISVIDPLGRTQVFVYDPAGRRTSTEYRIGGVVGTLLATEYAGYDAIGNMTTTRSARSASASDDTYKRAYTYDAGNRLSQVTEPVDGSSSITTKFGYDAAGNLTRLQDGMNNVTTYTWNPWNLRQSVVEPSTTGQTALADRTFTTSYDAGGLPVNETIPDVIVARVFDQLGRMTSESGSGVATFSASRTLGYDLAGRLTSWSHPDGTVHANYDDRGLLLSASIPGSTNSEQSSFRYDGAGRMTSRTDAAGTTNFTYTERGELDTIVDPLTLKTLDYSWNDAGQVQGVTYSGLATVRSYGYDDRGFLSRDTLAEGTNPPKYEARYEYDNAGNPTKQEITAVGNLAAGVHTYTYDRSDRLQTWNAPTLGTTGFGYDGAGNRTQAGLTSYTYDARNRLTSDGVRTYGWDARGTLNSISQGTTTSIAYDALGRQVLYSAPTGSTQYAYDALDRMVTRNDETFTYAGRELDPVTHPGATYGRSPAGELTSIRQGSSNYLAGENRHGDLAWLASLDGNVALSRIYDPYGAVTGSASSPGTASPALGFQGDYTDPTTGQVWMGARWYSPSTAAFSSRDTVFGQLGSPVTQNRYTYGNANPLKFFDPDGRVAMADAGGGYDPNDAQGIANTQAAEASMVQAQKVARAQWQRAHKPHKPSWWKRARMKFDEWTLRIGQWELEAIEGARSQVKETIDSVKQLKENPEQLVMLAESLVRDPIGTVKMMAQQTIAPVWNDIKQGKFASATGRLSVVGFELLLSKGAGRIGGLFRSTDDIAIAGGTGRFAARGLDAIEPEVSMMGRIRGTVDGWTSGVKQRGKHVLSQLATEHGHFGFARKTPRAVPNRAPCDLYCFGNRTQPRAPRPGIDIDVDGGGLVHPTSPPTGASAFGDPGQAPLTGHYHRVPAGTQLPPSLRVVADGADFGGPHPPTHYTIYPSGTMWYDDFVQDFLDLPWEYAGRK